MSQGGGYPVPLINPNSMGQAAQTSNGVADVTVVAAPGHGKRLLIPWIWVANRGVTPTVIQLKSGATVIAYLPVPKDFMGPLPPLPTPLVLGHNEALVMTPEQDVGTDISLTVGYAYGPSASSNV